MKIFKNITNGYRKIASGIAIVAFLTLMYFALIPAGTIAASFVATVSGDPIFGAIVKIVDYPQYNATTTSPLGAYTLNNVPYDGLAGGSTYLISASAPGYATNISYVNISSSAPVTKDFTLSPGYTKYFAAGAIEPTTDAYIQLSNPNDAVTSADVNFMLLDGSVVTKTVTMLPNSSAVVDAKQVLPTIPSYFSVKVVSEKEVAADRLAVFAAYNINGRIFDDVHESKGASEPNTTWYFAAGAIEPDTFTQILLLNPNATESATITAEFMLTDGTIVPRTISLGAHSRGSIDPRSVLTVPSYFSIKVTSNIPIVAERTIVFSNAIYNGRVVNGIHNTIGSTELSRTWYFAAGAIEADTFTQILFLNPNATQSATVTAEFMKTDGTVVPATISLGPHSRGSIDPRSVLTVPSYFSVRVTSDIPVMAERTAVFANSVYNGKSIKGFHNTIGSTKLSNKWSVGGGYVGPDVMSYIQILNPGSQPAHITAKFILTDGTSIPYSATIGATSRFSIDSRSLVPTGWYSAQITSSDEPVMVEKTEVFAGVLWNGNYVDGFGNTVVLRV